MWERVSSVWKPGDSHYAEIRILISHEEPVRVR